MNYRAAAGEMESERPEYPVSRNELRGEGVAYLRNALSCPITEEMLTNGLISRRRSLADR